MTDIRYVKEPGTSLVRNRGDGPDSTGGLQLLLGARLHCDVADEIDHFVPAHTMQNDMGEFREGFVDIRRISEKQQLKIFYVDVGQGDASLIEAEHTIAIIDGGPHSRFFSYLKKRLKALRRADVDAGLEERAQLHVDAVVVSHFDQDHYKGLIKLLESDELTFGKLYHNGLPRYGVTDEKDIDLGDVTKHHDGARSISMDLTDIDSARELLDEFEFKTKSGKANVFKQFLTAAIDAHDNDRLDAMKPLCRRRTDGDPETIPDLGSEVALEVLGPMTTKETGSRRLPVFPNHHDITDSNPSPPPSESHTINGNSVVLRLLYHENTFLFGGDLNQPAQTYLREKYGDDLGPFVADVNKACHHGSSDFDIDYVKSVKPRATVFSSGDDATHDHPLPDAMGAAARHSRGTFPLLFSTELIREGDKLGHVNARSNGEKIVMAQRKERPSTKKKWHSFPLPYKGPFADH